MYSLSIQLVFSLHSACIQPAFSLHSLSSLSRNHSFDSSKRLTYPLLSTQFAEAFFQLHCLDNFVKVCNYKGVPYSCLSLSMCKGGAMGDGFLGEKRVLLCLPLPSPPALDHGT